MSCRPKGDWIWQLYQKNSGRSGIIIFVVIQQFGSSRRPEGLSLNFDSINPTCNLLLLLTKWQVSGLTALQPKTERINLMLSFADGAAEAGASNRRWVWLPYLVVFHRNFVLATLSLTSLSVIRADSEFSFTVCIAGGNRHMANG